MTIGITPIMNVFTIVLGYIGFPTGPIAFYFGLLILTVSYLATEFKPGLRAIPGPFIARFTSLYRAFRIAKGDAPELYRHLHEKYGPIVRTGPNTVDISDPAALPVIYGISSKFVKSKFYTPFSPVFEGKVMPSMFSIRDPVSHQTLRRPVAQKFSMSSIKSLEPFADECTTIFIDTMKSLQGQKVDLGVWLQWYAFDVIGAITFQRRFGFMERREDVMGMISGLELGLRYAAIIGQVPAIHPWLMGNSRVTKFLTAQPFVRIADPLRTMVNITQECIDGYDRLPVKAHGDRPDFLAWLRSEESKGKPLSNRDMMNHLSNNLLAGSDTTAISLRAILYFLVRNPEVYRTAQQEVDNADRDGKLSSLVTYAECLELPYLQAVMKEAMRCHPGVSFPLERIVPEGGIKLCGTHLEAGTIVGMNAAVIHRDKTVFGSDADEFRPERWIESGEEPTKLMNRHLMTFGYGSRACIGKNISIMEMGKLIPQILRHFEIKWASDEPEWHVETFWFAKQSGLICEFLPRKFSKMQGSVREEGA